MIALVDGNNFFVSCERSIDPSLEGKAVAVLSNNDGCCVARSNEFKALGIPMGTPYFKLRDRERSGELLFRSSNYELYGDISRRIVSILRSEAVEVEQYSIDEAFATPPVSVASFEEWGVALRAKILQWTGIPCGIGFAGTKTLAKIANHIAKKKPSGVYVLPGDPGAVLDALPVGEVWGIGRKLAAKLRALGIFTAGAFMRLPDDAIRAAGSVTALRTAMELRGIPSLDGHAYDADPDSITCSRTFGEYVTDSAALSESLASFAALAAAKLRRHALVAAGCNAFAQIGTAESHVWAERTVMFPRPTSATGEILNAIRDQAGGLFSAGAKYRKSGIVMFGLEKKNAPRQGDLFAGPAPARDSREDALYGAVDSLNGKLGAGTVTPASAGLASRPAPWRFKRDKLSPRATTRWSELLVIPALPRRFHDLQAKPSAGRPAHPPQ